MELALQRDEDPEAFSFVDFEEVENETERKCDSESARKWSEKEMRKEERKKKIMYASKYRLAVLMAMGENIRRL
jgi:hypothetical protein